MKNLAAALSAALFMATPSTQAEAPKALAAQAKAILQSHCADCHGGGKASKGGFGFVLDREQLVSRLLVVPGKGGQSELLARIQHVET